MSHPFYERKFRGARPQVPRPPFGGSNSLGQTLHTASESANGHYGFSGWKEVTAQ